MIKELRELTAFDPAEERLLIEAHFGIARKLAWRLGRFAWCARPAASPKTCQPFEPVSVKVAPFSVSVWMKASTQ
jgi:hypothetical protein